MYMCMCVYVHVYVFIIFSFLSLFPSLFYNLVTEFTINLTRFIIQGTKYTDVTLTEFEDKLT